MTNTSLEKKVCSCCCVEVRYLPGMAIRIRNPQFHCRIRIPIFFLNINIWILRNLFHVKNVGRYVKFKGNFMDVKCFVICTDLLLPLKVNFSCFEIQIFMLLKLESESGESKSAMQKICNRIRNSNPPIFWPDCHPW